MQSHMMVPNPKKKYRINELDKKIVAFSPYYRVACNGKERKKERKRGRNLLSVVICLVFIDFYSLTSD